MEIMALIVLLILRFNVRSVNDKSVNDKSVDLNIDKVGI